MGVFVLVVQYGSGVGEEGCVPGVYLFFVLFCFVFFEISRLGFSTCDKGHSLAREL